MTVYKSRCHCGAVHVELETDTDPADIEVRECQCSFCRAHGAVSASDPNGRIRYIEQEPGTINRSQSRSKLNKRENRYLGDAYEHLQAWLARENIGYSQFEDQFLGER